MVKENKAMSMNKKKKDKDLLPWGETISLTFRMFGFLAGRMPKYLIFETLYNVWGALTPYVGIYISALIIDELAAGAERKRLYTLVIIALVSAAVISAVSALLRRLRDTESCNLYMQCYSIYTEKMLRLDFADADSERAKALLSKIIESQNSSGRGLCSLVDSYIAIVQRTCSLFGGVALSVSLFMTPVPEGAGALTILNSPVFTVLLLALLLAVTFISPILGTKANSYWARAISDANLGNRLWGHFGFLPFDKSFAEEIRIYNLIELFESFTKDKTTLFMSSGPLASYSKGPAGALSAASSAISVLSTGFVYAYVCLKSLGGAFGVGAVTQYVSAVTMLAGNVRGIMSAIGSIHVNATFLKNIDELLNYKDTMRIGHEHLEPLDAKDYEIEFRGVSFKYPGADEYALKDVNIKFGRGERLAVVGRNGSGKTTFIKLLCRLYDPTEGVILLNGRDIREYDYDEYLERFSVVFQDFSLPMMRLGQVVASGEEYDEKAARECLTLAGFGERLDTLADGLETYIYTGYDETGVDVSGGEAQKIAIARSLYKNSPFIVLDEPTAALDPLAEAEIYESFNELVDGKTSVYISHRLSSCRFCGDIAVFDGGRLAERGSHDELLSLNAKYAELWNAQAQYYEGE